MNDETHLESGIGTALRAYADDVHPDLEALVRTSRGAGGRIRRRRQLGGSIAAAAAVAGVIGVASLGAQLGRPDAAPSPGFAGQPTAGATHRAIQSKTCAKSPKLDKLLAQPPRGVTGANTASKPVVSGPDLQRVTSKIRQGRRGTSVCTLRPLTSSPASGSGQAPPSVYQGQAVTIHLAGWRQVGTVGDDKQALEGPGGAVADIVWRPAAEHDAWASSTDKGDTAGVWTSEVHDGVFVSIQAGSGTSDADVQALGASLTWN